MKGGKECYHCKLWVREGEPHDCTTTTEEALTEHLPEELMDAWLRIKETAVSFGEQRIYASIKSIMFSRKHCYFFVRPQKKYLEVCFFLGRTVKAPQIGKVMRSGPTSRSKSRKVAHLIRVNHRDEVETPITDWLKEAYEVSLELSTKVQRKHPEKKSRARKRVGSKKPKRKPAKK